MERATKVSKVPIPFSQEELNQEIERVEDQAYSFDDVKQLGDSAILIFRPAPVLNSFGDGDY